MDINISVIAISFWFLLLGMGLTFAILAEKIKRWDDIFYWLASACGYVLVGSILFGIIGSSIYGIIKGLGLV